MSTLNTYCGILSTGKKLLFNDDNKNGGNKLRTYKKLKNSYKMEKFLHSDVDKLGTYKVRNETKRNEINENETKRNETKRNQQKRNGTKSTK